ncbi:hypothetical protein ACLBSM_21060, partial [Klebsiella pneumoniae]
MNFFSFCRRGALTGMLLLLGITSAQAADWPRQVTDSYGTHTLPGPNRTGMSGRAGGNLFKAV